MIDINKYIKNLMYDKNFISGICDAKDLQCVYPNKIVPFTKKTQGGMCSPKKTMPEAKSIIVVGVPFSMAHTNVENHENIENYESSELIENNNSSAFGRIASFAAGYDYHKNVKQILSDLVSEIKKNIDVKTFIGVDSTFLNERELAKKAGIGWQGKNGLIISNEFGSLFNIGYILTDLELETTTGYESSYSKCGECSLCLDACPTKAHTQDGICFNYTRCISYLTQKKAPLSDAEMEAMSEWIFGCDICQNMCRYNKKSTANEYHKKELYEILDMDSEKFAKKYGDSAMSWIGRDILSRNAIISLANQKINIDISKYESKFINKEILNSTINYYYKKINQPRV